MGQKKTLKEVTKNQGGTLGPQNEAESQGDQDELGEEKALRCTERGINLALSPSKIWQFQVSDGERFYRTSTDWQGVPGEWRWARWNG